MKTYDVVIVGAGIIGLSIAWQLARRSQLKLLILDKGAGVGEGSTGASSAVCRHRYSSDDMVLLAKDGIDAYRRWRAFTGLAEPRAEFHNDGTLWLTGSDTGWADVEHVRMQQLGVATEVLDDDGLKDRFPALNPCIRMPDLETGQDHDCVGGGRHLFELEGGYVDPVAAAQDLVDACSARGVDIRFRSRVDSIEVSGGRVKSVMLAGGETIDAPLLINAAGPWCSSLYDMVGLKVRWDLQPVRVQMLYRDRPAEVKGHIPVTADIGCGIYFRTQNRGQQLIVGSVLEEDERETVSDPDQFQQQADDEFTHKIMHLLHHRLTDLPYRGRIRSYCGLYTVNRDDVHPILGATEIDGFWIANGFSGHGFKLAPAIGSLLAQAIVGTSISFDTGVALSLFTIDRAPIHVALKSVLA